MKSFMKEFKEFAVRGNVFDLAVGVIMGGAFGKIIASLVADVLMPIIGILFGGVNFEELKIVLKAAAGEVPESAIYYGKFIQTTIDFIIIAFVVFILVRTVNRLKKEEEEAPAEPPAQEVLLTEIRDLLKK